jgi:hypothetical protein
MPQVTVRDYFAALSSDAQAWLARQANLAARCQTLTVRVHDSSACYAARPLRAWAVLWNCPRSRRRLIRSSYRRELLTNPCQSSKVNRCVRSRKTGALVRALVLTAVIPRPR